MIPPTIPATVFPASITAQSRIAEKCHPPTASEALLDLLERAQDGHELAAVVQQSLNISLLTLRTLNRPDFYKTAEQADGSQISVDFKLASQVTVSALVGGRMTHACVLTNRHPAWECLFHCRDRVNLIAIWKQWADKFTFSRERRSEALDRMMACLLLNEPELSLEGLGLTSLPERLPPGVHRLNISHNRLKIINLDNNHLLSLDVSNNPFTTLSVCNNQLTTLNVRNTSPVCLYLAHNQLSTLPDLPISVEIMNVSHNRLDTLTELPSKLKKLEASNNLLTVMRNLPADLEVIHVDNNRLTTLGELPGRLYSLDANDNLLTVLPALPDSLHILTVGNNQLTTLSDLPGKLKTLHVCRNHLTALPQLPRSLTKLRANNNQLQSLPGLPEKLKMLCVNQNKLIQIPPLPDGIDALIIRENLLTLLPPLPKNLSHLDASYNFFTTTPPRSPRMAFFEVTPQYNYSRNFIIASIHSSTILTLEVLLWSSADQQLSTFRMWDPLIKENGGVEFILFLNKLRSGVNGQSAMFRKWVGHFLTEIAGDAELRKKVFMAAEEAGSSCADRAALAWNTMQTIRALYHVEHNPTKTSPAQFLKLARQIFYLQTIEKLAARKYRSFLTCGIQTDQIELYLKYLLELKEPLQLPENFAPQMNYPMLSNLSKTDITQAKNTVQETERREFLSWLVNSDHCQNYLQRNMTEDERNTFAEKRLELYNEIYAELKQAPVPENDPDVVRVLGKEATSRTNSTLFGPLVEATFFPPR